MKRVDITGQRFGKLTVIESAGVYRSPSGKHHEIKWRCLCDCGNSAVVNGSNLRTGHTTSCGECKVFFRRGGYMIGVAKNGREFSFDLDDFETVKRYEWTVADSGYVEAHVERRTLRMHRLLLDVDKGEYVDHINGDKTDCRKHNLRISTNRQNLGNKNVGKNNQVGYKGVGYDKRRGLYYAYIVPDGNKKWLGYYPTPEEAATAYNKAAAFHFGEYARLNVLGQPYTTISAAI